MAKWSKDDRFCIVVVSTQLYAATFRCQATLKYPETIFTILRPEMMLPGKCQTQKGLCAGIIIA